MNNESFPFTMSDAKQTSSAAVFSAIIPSAISSKDQLFEALTKRLRLPNYFGNNWDSLEECLRDLSWIAEPQIVIAHESLPLTANSRDQKIYIEILANALAHHQKQSSPKLRVSFPSAAESALRSLLANA